jgi:methylenetetrahydrofolate--tRNA-(uracil-5-)-methyltransferase
MKKNHQSSTPQNCKACRFNNQAAIGLLAGLNAAVILEGKQLQPPPPATAIGALLHYITSPASAANFQPMNINFGILEHLPVKRMKKKEKHLLYVKHAMQALNDWMIS